jgi:hypothetical protein
MIPLIKNVFIYEKFDLDILQLLSVDRRLSISPETQLDLSLD